VTPLHGQPLVNSPALSTVSAERIRNIAGEILPNGSKWVALWTHLIEVVTLAPIPGNPASFHLSKQEAGLWPYSWWDLGPAAFGRRRLDNVPWFTRLYVEEPSEHGTVQTRVVRSEASRVLRRQFRLGHAAISRSLAAA
jgi:hypothetical protein